MTKYKIAFTSLAIVLLTGTLSAAPLYISENRTPSPVGGMQMLGQSAKYPQWAQEDRIESDVVILFKVEADGNISNMRIVQSGGLAFDKSAINAVLNTSWQPAMQNGEAVAVTLELPFEYRVQDGLLNP